MIDFTGGIRKHKLTFSNAVKQKVRVIKFIILCVIIVLALRGIHAATFFDPLVIATRLVSPDLTLGLRAHIGTFFGIIILMSALLCPRLWCRALCPLGALYAFVSKIALLKRRVKACTRCERCTESCRMGAITDDGGYVKSECILCMDCIYDCPQKNTSFGFTSP